MSERVQFPRAMSEETHETTAEVRLLTVAEFAKEIGKTERQVYRYIKNKSVQSLSPEETGQAGVRISSAELERFRAEGGGFRMRPSGVGSSFESFEDSAEGLAADRGSLEDATGVEAPEVSLSVPLERHEAAVMRLGYLQSQFEQSQRLLTEGGQRTDELRRQVQDLQEQLKSMQDKVRQVEALEQELASLKKQSQELKEEDESHRSQLEEAQEQIMRFKVKAEVESDTRAEAESKLRTLSVRLEEAERRANEPWYKRIF